MLAFLLAAGLNSAHAVPVTMTHQGRLLDSNGAGLTGFHDLTFALYDANAGGNVLWYDTVAASFTDGYYSVTAAAGSNPLDDDIFENDSLYLELALDSNPAMSPRLAVTSTPFARVAGYAETAEVATSVDGGLVDAAEVAINGTTVIDSNGDWVAKAKAVVSPTSTAVRAKPLAGMAPTGSVPPWPAPPSWSSIANRPAGLDDGDDDTLGSLGCATGEIVAWNGSAFGPRAADNGLTEAEVEAYIVNDPIDLAAGSMVDGSEILTDDSVLMPEWANVLNVPADLADGDDDTLAGLSCQGGEMAVWDAATSTWICSTGGSTQGAFATEHHWCERWRHRLRQFGHPRAHSR